MPALRSRSKLSLLPARALQARRALLPLHKLRLDPIRRTLVARRGVLECDQLIRYGCRSPKHALRTPDHRSGLAPRIEATFALRRHWWRTWRVRADDARSRFRLP